VTDIFISYRTADEPVTAVFIKRMLSEKFGAERVFLDNTSIPLGHDFSPVIEAALESCQVLVAVVGPRWFTRDQHGRRHVDDPADWVRREIIRALDRDAAVIPVLVGDVRLTAGELPDELAALPARQFLRLRVRSVENDLRPLVAQISRVVPPQPQEDAGSPVAGSTIVSNQFHGKVEAPHGVFGVSNVYRS
jgi:hypothetical protein